MGKYEQTILRVFENKLDEGEDTGEAMPFDRDDIEHALDELGITVKNVPDILYAYRSRRPLGSDQTVRIQRRHSGRQCRRGRCDVPVHQA